MPNLSSCFPGDVKLAPDIYFCFSFTEEYKLVLKYTFTSISYSEARVSLQCIEKLYNDVDYLVATN